MRISDWSSDVCSSDLLIGQCGTATGQRAAANDLVQQNALVGGETGEVDRVGGIHGLLSGAEETVEIGRARLQSGRGGKAGADRRPEGRRAIEQLCHAATGN